MDEKKPRIAIVGGASMYASMAAAALAVSHPRAIDIFERPLYPDFDPYEIRALEPLDLRPLVEPRGGYRRSAEIDRHPIILGGGIKTPKWPADPIKQAARKRQRNARRKSR